MFLRYTQHFTAEQKFAFGFPQSQAAANSSDHLNVVFQSPKAPAGNHPSRLKMGPLHNVKVDMTLQLAKKNVPYLSLQAETPSLEITMFTIIVTMTITISNMSNRNRTLSVDPIVVLTIKFLPFFKKYLFRLHATVLCTVLRTVLRNVYRITTHPVFVTPRCLT